MMMIITIIIIINLYGVNGVHTFLYCFVSDLLSVADLEFSREVSLKIIVSYHLANINFQIFTPILFSCTHQLQQLKIPKF